MYVHIGQGETGTTALQKCFWKNREELARRDILYPPIGTLSGAHHFLSIYTPKFLKQSD